MKNKLTTSEAGQRLLSRVYQVIANTSKELDNRHSTQQKNSDEHRDTINQKIAIARTKGQVYLSDINTLGEIFLANSQRKSNKLFTGNNLSKNIHDLKTLYNMLSDPADRKAFIANADSQPDTNVISFPK